MDALHTSDAGSGVFKSKQFGKDYGGAIAAMRKNASAAMSWR